MLNYNFLGLIEARVHCIVVGINHLVITLICCTLVFFSFSNLINVIFESVLEH